MPTLPDWSSPPVFSLDGGSWTTSDQESRVSNDDVTVALNLVQHNNSMYSFGMLICLEIHLLGAGPGSKTNFVAAKLYVHFLRNENN